MDRSWLSRGRLLDVAAVIGLSGPALMVLYSSDSRATAVTATVLVLVAVAATLWVFWRRSAQCSRAAALAFAVVATATIALGDGALYYGIVWTACLMIGVTFASAAALWSYAVILVGLVIVLHVAVGTRADALIAEAIGTLFFAGIAAAVTAIVRDSIRTSEGLQTALARLHATSAQLRARLDTDRDLVIAQERERTARDLHDGLGHRLTAIGLSIDYAVRVNDQALADAELHRARAVVSESLDAMRRLVRAMHPIELSALRHADAFRAVADGFVGTGLTIDVHIEGDDAAMSHDHSLLLLRFVQEGLTNVVRHSRGTAVSLHISVAESDHAVCASLTDNGGAADQEITEGFGLRSLRERAEALGGSCGATTTTRGISLTLTLPSPEEPHTRTPLHTAGQLT